MLSPRLASGLQLLVGTQFQVLFHSPSGVLFAFPSRYLFTIGHCRVFSLRRWSSRIPTKFHVFRCTWDTARALEPFVYRAITFYGSAFQQNSTRLSSPTLRSHDPHQCYALEIQTSNLKIQKKIISKSQSHLEVRCLILDVPVRSTGRFRLFRFRSPLLPKSLLFSLPPLTKMFQFSGLSPSGLRRRVSRY